MVEYFLNLLTRASQDEYEELINESGTIPDEKQQEEASGFSY